MRLIGISGLIFLTTMTPSSQWWLEDFSQVNQLTGKGVVIAVIDTGVDSSHPDLAGTVIGGADFSGAGTPTGTSPVGPSGYHGTMVASLIVGQGRTSGGVIGIAPDAKILSLSIGLGITGADTDRQMATAVRWAVDNGADIINLSVSRDSQSWPKIWDSAFLYAMQNDVVIVAASGNREGRNTTATAPATIPGVISVTALDRQYKAIADVGAEGIGVTVAAPGVEMFGSYPGGEIRGWAGSSAAAPIVSGLLALMLEADPSASANDLIQRLIATSLDLGSEGFDATYGYGLIDPQMATVAKDRAEANALGSLEQWIELYRPSAAEEEAPLVLPPLAEQTAPINQLIDGAEEADPWSNPLLYLLLVPLALLLWLSVRNRFGRDGKKNQKVTKSHDGRDQ